MLLFYTGDTSIIYALLTSMILFALKNQQKEKMENMWPIYDSFDIFISNLDGKITKQLTYNNGYDAEATVSPLETKLYSHQSDPGTWSYTHVILMVGM